MKKSITTIEDGLSCRSQLFQITLFKTKYIITRYLFTSFVSTVLQFLFLSRKFSKVEIGAGTFHPRPPPPPPRPNRVKTGWITFVSHLAELLFLLQSPNYEMNRQRQRRLVVKIWRQKLLIFLSIFIICWKAVAARKNGGRSDLHITLWTFILQVPRKRLPQRRRIFMLVDYKSGKILLLLLL